MAVMTVLPQHWQTKLWRSGPEALRIVVGGRFGLAAAHGGAFHGDAV